MHNTYRHDLKIHCSEEGRCQKTAGAFTKGLLDLEGELTPIIVSMINKDEHAQELLDDAPANDINETVERSLSDLLNSPGILFDNISKIYPISTFTPHQLDIIQAIGNSLDRMHNLHSNISKLRNILQETFHFQSSSYYLHPNDNLKEYRESKEPKKKDGIFEQQLTPNTPPDSEKPEKPEKPEKQEKPEKPEKPEKQENAKNELNAIIDEKGDSGNQSKSELNASEGNCDSGNHSKNEKSENKIHWEKISDKSSDSGKSCGSMEEKSIIDSFVGCNEESVILIYKRWRKLEFDFYNKKENKFNISKIMDICDSIKYDVLHNYDFFIKYKEIAEPIYKDSDALSKFVEPFEYGISMEDKVKIGLKVVTPLLNKVKGDVFY